MFIRDIAQILQANGIGVLGTDIFLGQLPDSPDNVVVLYPTGGFAQDLPLPDVKMTAQVLVRDKSYQTGYERIWRVFNLLDGGERRFLEAPSGRKMVAQAMQPPLFLERDENGHSIFVFNVSIWTRRD
jgi:hypothetical protein